MTVAVKVIDAGLREDFGFEHLLWVYSGRRGIHCWVCDDRARKMSNESRAAVAEYFGVYKGADARDGVAAVNLTSPLHPSLQRAYADVLDPFWRRKILPDQELLTHEKTKDAILAMIPDAEARSRVESAWKGSDAQRRAVGEARADRAAGDQGGREELRAQAVPARHRVRARVPAAGRGGVQAHEPSPARRFASTRRRGACACPWTPKPRTTSTPCGSPP